jgi:hypothetical protein
MEHCPIDVDAEDSFAYTEAQAKLGRTVITLTEWSGVPVLTVGEVVEIYRRAGSGSRVWGVSVRWSLPDRQGQVLQDGFSKAEYDSYLIEVGTA